MADEETKSWKIVRNTFLDALSEAYIAEAYFDIIIIFQRLVSDQ